MKRRTFLSAAIATTAVLPMLANAQTALPPAEPRDWSGATPLRYPDPDLIALDPRFQRYILFNTRFSAITPARYGRKAQPGTASGAIWYGVKFPIIASCAGSKTMAG